MELPQSHVRILELAKKQTPLDDVSPDLREALEDLKTASWVTVRAVTMHDPRRLHLTKEGASHWIERIGSDEQPIPVKAVGQNAGGTPEAESDEQLVETEAASLRRVGEVWHLSYTSEKADFPVAGTKFLGWLAKLLAKPNHAWTVAELLGDPDGKLAADALLGGEGVMDTESLRKIWGRMEEINEAIADTGGSEKLEDEKAELLRKVERHSAKGRMETSVTKAYNNITTQKRKFLGKLKKDMPQLTAHLKACLIQDGKAYTLAYDPPKGTPPWQIENLPA